MRFVLLGRWGSKELKTSAFFVVWYVCALWTRSVHLVLLTQWSRGAPDIRTPEANLAPGVQGEHIGSRRSACLPSGLSDAPGPLRAISDAYAPRTRCFPGVPTSRPSSRVVPLVVGPATATPAPADGFEWVA